MAAAGCVCGWRAAYLRVRVCVCVCVCVCARRAAYLRGRRQVDPAEAKRSVSRPLVEHRDLGALRGQRLISEQFQAEETVP